MVIQWEWTNEQLSVRQLYSDWSKLRGYVYEYIIKVLIIRDCLLKSICVYLLQLRFFFGGGDVQYLMYVYTCSMAIPVKSCFAGITTLKK